MELKNFSLLQHAPHLRDEILARSWTELFDPEVLAGAAPYTKPGKLLNWETVQHNKSLVVEARFDETIGDFTETAVFFDYNRKTREYDLDSECSCDDYFLCEHAAAVLLMLAERFGSPVRPANPAGLDAETSAWLDCLGVVEDTPAPELKPDNRFLAYCIKSSPLSTAPPELHLHVGRRLKSGELRIDRGSHADADPLRPPGYMGQDDLLPCILIRQHAAKVSPNSHMWESVPLDGPTGHSILTECLKTGRLFHVVGKGEPVPVRSADHVQAAPAWRVAPDGSATPTLGLPDRALLIPTSPLFALLPPGDSAASHATLHLVQKSSHPDALLAIWASGPSVPSTALANLSGHLKSVAAALPTPPAVIERKLPKVRPSARLTLYRKNPFMHAGLHMSGQPEPIVAELAFLYHGHPAPVVSPPRGKLPDFSHADEGAVLTIPRHKSGEQEIIETLQKTLGVVPACHLDPVPPENLGCFLPATHPRDWDLAWARTIANDLPTLEKQGWEITIDTSAHIELHPIGPDNLDTGLAELPEHGIDWFQFDPGYLTPSGTKQSLLPLLCAYLERIDPATIPDSLESLPDDDQTFLKDPATKQFVSIDTRRLLTLVSALHDLFGASPSASPEPFHRLQAAGLADALELNHSETHRALAELGRNLKSVTALPKRHPPKNLTATLRHYQVDGFRWMQFLARHSLNGILADDMGLGKTLQALAHLQAEVSGRRTAKRPSLVVAPTSVIGNWAAEARKFAPKLKVLSLHGSDRSERFPAIPKHHLVLTTYALLHRDFDELNRHEYHLVILDEAQHIKNPASKVSQLACQLDATHRLALSGTPIENHLGELWSQFRFLMPGFLGSSEKFRKTFRTPIEKHRDAEAQALLNRRVAPLILRRTKEQVATELPRKTEIVHTIPLHPKQIDLYETVRAAMDKRVRDAISEKGLAKSHIIVLDALLKLRQTCCHPRLLKLAAARKVSDSAKFDFLTTDLLPTLLDEGRRILLFSSFTSMLALVEEHLGREKIAFAKIIGSTTRRQDQIDRFQNGDVPLFLISLKAGGTGLNLTAADTVIHYDPWWNPAAENQATDRAHRIGQDKPVFVHKLIAEGSIEERIQTLQSQKSALVEALLTDDTNRLQLNQDTLRNLLAPLD